MRRHPRVPDWRRETLRTTLWLVPAGMVAAAVFLFVLTYRLDRAAYDGAIDLPSWVNTGTADAARQVLIAIAAAVITVAGVVFSVTILALTLASQQFGPRMLRSFIRDAGTQITLGVFVATFTYSVVALGSVSNSGARGEFVPHLSVTVALGLTLGSLGVLIYFIHHVAASIQLTSVVAGIARDFSNAVQDMFDEAAQLSIGQEEGPSLSEILTLMDRDGVDVPARASGFLQAVGHKRLIGIASSQGAVIRLLNRPGHFLIEGRPLAMVWPSNAAPVVAAALDRAHVVGPHRTLTQDIGFAVDQLVEISLRALSPAVNDTFTALNCIDWLTDSICKVTAHPLPDGVYRDGSGHTRVIDPVITYERLVKGAFDKIRQAGRGTPAVYIRQLQSLALIAQCGPSLEQREVLGHHADMILRASNATVPEQHDSRDVRDAYTAFRTLLAG